MTKILRVDIASFTNDYTNDSSVLHWSLIKSHFLNVGFEDFLWVKHYAKKKIRNEYEYDCSRAVICEAKIMSIYVERKDRRSCW